MTLDLEKFISNSIKTQAKIQHLDVSTKTVKSMPKSVESLIIKEYGDNYLLDADYVSFFWGSINKEEIKKLFNVVDKALGQSANKLTNTDFKKINFESQSKDADSTEDDADNQDDITVDDTTEISGDDEDVESADDESTDSEESLDEDDESIGKPTKTSYFFLKITLK